MVNNQNDLVRSIRDYLTTGEWSKSLQAVVDGASRSLPLLGEFLREDESIERTERLESIYKAILRAELGRPMSGMAARELAKFQKGLGFVLKYKSYAVKAATPLGYSIFIQNDGEGFSFQRHIKHKLEVFHILDVKPGGFVFLCDFRYWKMVYERRAFENWLAGEANDLFDPYRFLPKPGDVFVISELGVVHTVIGCVLEEYATVSTDMVDRLHDQNAGKGIPYSFTRTNAENVLRAIEPPARNRVVRGFEDRAIKSLDPVVIEGGERVPLCDSFVRAARCSLRPGAETALAREEGRAVILRVFKGCGSVVVADNSELRGSKPSIEFGRSDLILIPPGISYSVINEGSDDVEYSEHCIAPEVAFV